MGRDKGTGLCPDLFPDTNLSPCPSILLLLLYSYTIREKAVQKFAGGVYEEKGSDWNTEF